MADLLTSNSAKSVISNLGFYLQINTKTLNEKELPFLIRVRPLFTNRKSRCLMVKSSL